MGIKKLLFSAVFLSLGIVTLSLSPSHAMKTEREEFSEEEGRPAKVRRLNPIEEPNSTRLTTKDELDDNHLQMIFSWLPYTDLLSCKEVCTAWRPDDRAWEAAAERYEDSGGKFSTEFSTFKVAENIGDPNAFIYNFSCPSWEEIIKQSKLEMTDFLKQKPQARGARKAPWIGSGALLRHYTDAEWLNRMGPKVTFANIKHFKAMQAKKKGTQTTPQARITILPTNKPYLPAAFMPHSVVFSIEDPSSGVHSSMQGSAHESQRD